MKKIILITIVLLLIITVIISIVLLKNENETENNNASNNSIETKTENEIQLEQVKSATAFFTVQSCVSKFITYVQDNDKESVFKILDSNYIKKNNITKENVLTKVEQIEDLATFKAEKMYLEEIDEDNIRYYVKGILQKSTISQSDDVEDKTEIINDDFKIVVTLNYNDMIFSVAPLEDGGIFNEERN